MRLVWAQVKHNFLVEYRSWPQSVSLLLFVWTIAYVISRVRDDMSMAEFNFLFWVILLLTSINVAVRSASHSGQSERLLMYSLASPMVVLVGLIVFNIIYLLLVALAFYLMMMLLFYPKIVPSFDYVGLVIVGAVAIAAVLAFVSAISRHIDGQNTALSILSIPLLIPVVLLLNSIGGNLIMGNQLQDSKYVALLGITMMSIALSIVLFPFIWRE